MGVQEAEKLKQICSVIHQTVDTEKIYLFGSYAYGVPTQNSDFDCKTGDDFAGNR